VEYNLGISALSPVRSESSAWQSGPGKAFLEPMNIMSVQVFDAQRILTGSASNAEGNQTNNPTCRT